jgi:glycosyltransferase involved in cell wall biosynthesis
MCRDLELDEWVEFTGRVSDGELRSYLSTADVCLSPDPANGLNEFHTMNKTLEYMAMARPVVAFDLRETRVSAADAALYAIPNDSLSFAVCIERLLDDPGLRDKLGARGRQRIENGMGWDQTKASLLQAYSRVFLT